MRESLKRCLSRRVTKLHRRFDGLSHTTAPDLGACKCPFVVESWGGVETSIPATPSYRGLRIQGELFRNVLVAHQVTSPRLATLMGSITCNWPLTSVLSRTVCGSLPLSAVSDIFSLTSLPFHIAVVSFFRVATFCSSMLCWILDFLLHLVTHPRPPPIIHFIQLLLLWWLVPNVATLCQAAPIDKAVRMYALAGVAVTGV